MENNDIRELLDRYLDGTATRAERHLVESHYHHLLAAKDGLANGEQIERATGNMRNAIQKQIGIPIHPVSMERPRKISRWLPYAAAILLVATAGWWAISNQRSAVSTSATEILPGGNRATLTLGDGRTIALSETQRGIVVSDGITYLDGSLVTAHEELKMEHESPTFNTITTPKGGTYQVTLPDGSRVWLNANSTLTYPSRFSEQGRVVELTGEAFFAIQPAFRTDHHQLSKEPASERLPFSVVTAGQTIEVLGTQFNIAAYAEDAETKTTLVEGRVQIVNRQSNTATQLRPGEQSTVRGEHIETHQVDPTDYTAWKDGFFNFNEKTLQEAMNQLARWYDIEVNYEAGIPNNVTLRGKMERDLPLQTVLDILHRLKLKYRVEGRQLTIINN